MPFATVFQLYYGSQHTYPCFPFVKTTDSGERGMNPAEMTNINPGKEYWPSQGSNQQPPVLKSATLLTELWGLACETALPPMHCLVPKTQI